MKFDNAHRYTIAGPGRIRMEAFSIGNALIDVVSGSHTISAPMTLASDTTLNVTPAASVLTISGDVDGSAADLTKSGAGTITMTKIRAASLHVAGGTLSVVPNGGPAGTSVIGGPVTTAAANAKLNLNDNDLIVNHDGSVTEESIRQLVRNGRAPSSTRGIFSTPGPVTDDRVLAVANNAEWGKTSFNGFAIDSSTIVGKYTFFGDANLDGAVTGDDYLAVDAGLGIGNSWIEGDFNMDTFVTGDDYLAVDANLGKGSPTPLAFAELKEQMVALHVSMFGEDYLAKLADVEANGFTTAVPEPGASVALLAMVGALTARRRDRRGASPAL